MTRNSLRHDSSGAVAVITALVLAAVIGCAALGSEAAVWYLDKRTMQGAADASAFSAATEIMDGTTGTSSITAQAKAVASTDGFTDGSNAVTVTVNNPPTAGNYTHTSRAVEVLIHRPQAVLLATEYAPTAVSLFARAVALAGYNGDGCVVSLDTANIADVTDIGNSTLNLDGCSLYIDSPNSSALTLTGSASITAQAAYIVGNVNDPSQITTTNCGSTSYDSCGLNVGTPPITDPYANVAMPAPGACDYTNYTVPNGTVEIPNPGGGTVTFCGGLTVNSGTTVTFDPGTYVIDGGTFKINGGATVCAPTCSTTLPANGDTFVLTGSGSDYAQMDVEGGANVTVYAPTSGATAGIAFFQDRNAPKASGSNANKFTGGSSQNITGAIYFPNQNVTFSGGASSGGAVCTQVIGLTLNFNGTSNLSSDCVGVPIKKVGTVATKLVE